MVEYRVETLSSADVASLISLDECKAFARVRHDFEDTVFSQLREAAVDVVERVLGRAVKAARLRAFFTQPGSTVRLPYPPLREVESVEYQALSGGWLPESDYVVDVVGDGVFGVIKKDDGWNGDSLRVTYQAGYLVLPPGLRHAILGLIAWWYDNRDSDSSIPDHVIRALNPYSTGLLA